MIMKATLRQISKDLKHLGDKDWLNIWLTIFEFDEKTSTSSN